MMMAGDFVQVKPNASEMAKRNFLVPLISTSQRLEERSKHNAQRRIEQILPHAQIQVVSGIFTGFIDMIAGVLSDHRALVLLDFMASPTKGSSSVSRLRMAAGRAQD